MSSQYGTNGEQKPFLLLSGHVTIWTNDRIWYLIYCYQSILLTRERYMQPYAVDKDSAELHGINKRPEMTQKPTRLSGWVEALKQVLPIYIAIHVAILILTYTATLFLLHHSLNYSLGSTVHTLFSYWYQWDTVHYTTIAASGYPNANETAFFPLYPLLIRAVMLVVRHALPSALLVSDAAGLGLLIVFYRLVEMDFGSERAWRSVLYLAVFPTAFFFAAAYTESLFLFLVLFSFYFMRRGHWWFAGLAAFFAGLTRATAVALFIPFCFEYLRQHDFQWRKFRLDILSCLGILGGILVFMLYCYHRFHDPLAFSHGEQALWGRRLVLPGDGFLLSIHVIATMAILTFYTMHNVINLSFGLCALILLVLAFVGPWKFAKKDWSYPLYGVVVYLFAICLPIPGSAAPLDSLDRYVLVIFPIFVVLAAIGKNRSFNVSYLIISLPTFAFLALLFLTGNWMV